LGKHFKNRCIYFGTTSLGADYENNFAPPFAREKTYKGKRSTKGK